MFTDKKPDICATIIQNTSKHFATLPTGHIGYIEVPITNENPNFYQVNDINTSIHNVTHTYHSDITKPVPHGSSVENNGHVRIKNPGAKFWRAWRLMEIHQYVQMVPSSSYVSLQYLS